MDIAKYISFHFKFFHFVSVFRNFFVSVNGLKIFPFPFSVARFAACVRCLIAGESIVLALNHFALQMPM